MFLSSHYFSYLSIYPVLFFYSLLCLLSVSRFFLFLSFCLLSVIFHIQEVSICSEPSSTIPVPPVKSVPIVVYDDAFDVLDAPRSNDFSGSAGILRPEEFSHFHCEECTSVAQISDPIFPPLDEQSDYLKSLVALMRAIRFDYRNGMITVV